MIEYWLTAALLGTIPVIAFLLCFNINLENKIKRLDIAQKMMLEDKRELYKRVKFLQDLSLKLRFEIDELRKNIPLFVGIKSNIEEDK